MNWWMWLILGAGAVAVAGTTFYGITAWILDHWDWQ